MTRQRKTEIADSLSPYDLDGTLQAAADRIANLIKEHGADACLDWNKYHYYPYDNEPSPRFEVMVTRNETDQEYRERVAEEQKLTAQQEARERTEFERLQQKFGQGK